MSKSKLDLVFQAVREEHERAEGLWPAFFCMHEGYAILLEEVDELWDAVKKAQKDNSKQYQDNVQKEAIQVAAMAIRFLHDLTLFKEE